MIKVIYIIRLICIILIPILLYYNYGWYSVLPLLLSILIPSVYYTIDILKTWIKLLKSK
jgi:hypothetical protein